MASVAGGSREAMWTTSGDGVVATVHAKGCSVVMMSICFVEAFGRCVVPIRRETLGLTVVEFAAFDRNVWANPPVVVAAALMGGGVTTTVAWCAPWHPAT